MSRILTLLLTASCFVIAAQPVQAEKKKSYTLICKGGAGMSASFERKIRFNKADLYITKIRFVKALKAAGKAKPAAGQCAWFDRPISANEPSVLQFTRHDKNPIYQLSIKRNNMRLVSAKPSELQLINAVYNSKEFIVQARRDKDVLKITKVGP
jgi:hypothetical protein